MANNKNLKLISSTNEAREKGKKGGINSGKARRERKALKEELLLLFEKGDIQEKMCLALIERALTGDVRAFETIRDTIGEKPTDKIETKLNEKYNGDTYISYKDFQNPQRLKQMLDSAANNNYKIHYVSEEIEKAADDFINKFIN